MSSKTKRIFLIFQFAFIALLVAIDQITKSIVILRLKLKPAFVLIKGVLELDYLENYGSAFGMFENKKLFLIIISIVFILILFYYLLKLPMYDRFDLFMHIFMAMIFAGGLGNLIDRFLYGYVVDFISFTLINYPIFNFADCCIVVGVICFGVGYLLKTKKE